MFMILTVKLIIGYITSKVTDLKYIEHYLHDL